MGDCFVKGRLTDIWVQPASGDAGGALGAAAFVWYQLLRKPRLATRPDFQKGSLLGPESSAARITAFLNSVGAKYERIPDEAQLLDKVATLLTEEKVVGWFQGRMEFGPRALGARSIIGDPRSPKMQSVMNLKIKYRESFRPFAPIVLRESASDWFEIEPQHESPYMLVVADVRKERQVPLDEARRKIMAESPDLCERVNVPRSAVPAVTHVDYSARLQTVDSIRNPRLHALLTRFLDRTGCPILVNTSFNVRGEPIVCTEEDAFRCFMATEMDVLVLEDCVLLKSDNAATVSASERQRHLSRFELD
jgi:carbamoyltransferase